MIFTIFLKSHLKQKIIRNILYLVFWFQFFLLEINIHFGNWYSPRKYFKIIPNLFSFYRIPLW